MEKIRTALTIAGSDSSGGAGIQADIKTMSFNGVYAMSAITALTAQNTRGVKSIREVDKEFLKDQLDQIFTDIYPDAVKIGMVSSKELIQVISEKLKEYEAKNIVLDPVMVATSGSKLLKDDAIEVLKEELFKLATIITPNIPEADIILGKKIKNETDMQKFAEEISQKYNLAVLIKGGHSVNDANDYLYNKNKGVWFRAKRIDNENTHGTGCSLSSAIASNLAKGYKLEEAAKMAKDYAFSALNTGLNLGKGHGPIDHGFDIKEKYRRVNL